MNYVKVEGKCYYMYVHSSLACSFPLLAIDKSTSSVYIMMEDRLGALFKTSEEYRIIETMVGSSLEGKKYKPLFSYFQHMKSTNPDEGAFRVLW